MFKKFIKYAACTKMHIAILASTVALCFGLINTAFALQFSQISKVYFFGDSLTDSGFYNLWPNLPSPPGPAPFPAGKAPTFTTLGGYTWAQYVARDIKGFVLPVYPGPNPPDTLTNNSIYPVPGFASGTLVGSPTFADYAAGGSTTNSIGNPPTYPTSAAPSLRLQIGQFLSTQGPTLDPNAVFFIWSGANDLLTLLPSNPTQLQLLTAAYNAAVNVASEVAQLSSRGAKRIVVFNLPNIGTTPAISAAGIPTLPSAMQAVSFTFNGMLNQELGKVLARYKVKVLYIDTYTLLDTVILASRAGQPYVVGGQSFLFTNTTGPACGPESLVLSAMYCNTGSNGYVFADGVHPTDMAHRLLSLYVETKILNWA